MRVKLSTSDVGLSNEDISTSRAELLDAYNEVLEQGINLNYASALVDNMLVGLDIVQKYNNSKDATAALESLQKIVSKSPVEITASCEGVGEALKAAWDTFIEICKTVWQKIKNFFIRLKNWMLGTNKANLEKTKQLKDRANAAKPGKESLAAGLEDLEDNKVIHRDDINAVIKFAHWADDTMLNSFKIIERLSKATQASSLDEAEKLIVDACNVSNSYDKSVVRGYEKRNEIEIVGHNLMVRGINADVWKKIYKTEGYIKQWNQQAILQALGNLETLGAASQKFQSYMQKFEAVSNTAFSEGAMRKLANEFSNTPPPKHDTGTTDGNTAQPEPASKNSKQRLFLAKCCLNAIRTVSAETARMISEIPRLHSVMNTEIEKVMNILGY